MYAQSALTLKENKCRRFNLSFSWVSMLFLNSWRVSSHIVRYDTNPPAVQKQHWHSMEVQIEPPLFECEREWAFRIQAIVYCFFYTSPELPQYSLFNPMKESSDFNGNEGIFRFQWQWRNLQILMAMPMKESSDFIGKEGIFRFHWQWRNLHWFRWQTINYVKDSVILTVEILHG